MTGGEVRLHRRAVGAAAHGGAAKHHCLAAFRGLRDLRGNDLGA